MWLLCGVVWCGVVWCSVLWCGLMWLLCGVCLSWYGGDDGSGDDDGCNGNKLQIAYDKKD